jgi:hypothetical protein
VASRPAERTVANRERVEILKVMKNAKAKSGRQNAVLHGTQDARRYWF